MAAYISKSRVLIVASAPLGVQMNDIFWFCVLVLVVHVSVGTKVVFCGEGPHVVTDGI